MSIRADHMLRFVIEPTLKRIGLYSHESAMLLLGTAAHESHLGTYLRQHPHGPALGVYQMEPATHDDCWANYLFYRQHLVDRLWSARLPGREPSLLITDLGYATAMARIQYLRDPKPVPSTLKGQAETWKNHWNTAKGAGTVGQYLEAWERLVVPTLDA